MIEPNTTKLKTLLVDDSAVYRMYLRKILAGISDVEVIGSVPDGLSALKILNSTGADLLLLDIEMPGMNGFEVLEVIQNKYPRVTVVLLSGVHKDGADMAMQALKKGAFDFIEKATFANPSDSDIIWHSRLSSLIREIIIKRSDSRIIKQPKLTAVSPESRVIPKISIVVIAASTGGPHSLEQVIPALPVDFPLPMLVVQHMPPLFTASLAESLARNSTLKVREAKEGDAVSAGTVLIAPGGRHMEVVMAKSIPVIRLTDGPLVNGLKPAVDILLNSLVHNYGNGILTVILTGMGNDGLEGVREIHKNGGYCLAQDEKTSLVFGMPKAVIEGGVANEVLGLGQIAKRIIEIARQPQESYAR